MAFGKFAGDFFHFFRRDAATKPAPKIIVDQTFNTKTVIGLAIEAVMDETGLPFGEAAAIMYERRYAANAIKLANQHNAWNNPTPSPTGEYVDL